MSGRQNAPGPSLNKQLDREWRLCIHSRVLEMREACMESAVDQSRRVAVGRRVGRVAALASIDTTRRCADCHYSMMRPWQQWSVERRMQDGEKLWRCGDVSWRRPDGGLLAAQKRKLNNLFFHLADGAGDAITLDSVESAMVDAHCSFAGAAASSEGASSPRDAVRAWFDNISSMCGGSAAISQTAFLEAGSALLTNSRLPDWLTKPAEESFRLVAPGGAMSRDDFVAWRTAVQRWTPVELARMQRIDLQPGALVSLEDVFNAASRDGLMLTEAEWRGIIDRWWTCGDAWDETAPHALAV